MSKKISKDEAFEMAKEIASNNTTKVLEENDIKPTLNTSALEQVKNQVDKLLKDFEEFYGPKGRGVKIVVHILKEDKNDTVAEKWNYDDNYSVVSAIDIGTAVKEDIYSDWKEWMLGYDGLINAKFLQTGRAVGGDPLPGNRFLGSTFFLVNGWKVKLADGDYRLTVNGNLYTEEGDDPFIPPDAPASKVTVVQTVSTLVETIGIAEALNITIDEVRDALWTTTLSVLASGDNTAAQIERIKSETGLIPAII